MITKKYICAVDLNNGFFEISNELGFSFDVLEGYLENIKKLMNKWANQGYIEIYQLDSERRYYFVKSTQKNSDIYLGMYHGRLLKGENDPIFIVTFEEKDYNFEKDPRYYATIRFIVNHDDIFGKMGEEKRNRVKMMGIYANINGLMKKNDEFELGDKFEVFTKKYKKDAFKHYFDLYGKIEKEEKMINVFKAFLFRRRKIIVFKYKYLKSGTRKPPLL